MHNKQANIKFNVLGFSMQASRAAPAIIFLDELDALAPVRSTREGGVDQVNKPRGYCGIHKLWQAASSTALQQSSALFPVSMSCSMSLECCC